MPLRYKIQLVCVGMQAATALVGAMAHALFITTWCLLFTLIHWKIAEFMEQAYKIERKEDLE